MSITVFMFFKIVVKGIVISIASIAIWSSDASKIIYDFRVTVSLSIVQGSLETSTMTIIH